MHRYRHYSHWLRNRFGETVYKVSVDGGFTCPNRDGTVAWGGCSYCSNDSFRPQGCGSEMSVEKQIEEGIEFLRRRFQANKFLVYWQNFSNTYRPVQELEDLYRSALEADPRIAGVLIGTRPDCVEDEKLDMLSRLAETTYLCLELGLESIFDATLKRVNRGHDFACFEDAVQRARIRGLDVCAHVILGFPWETRSQLLSYPAQINRLHLNFIKLHHLHIVRGTRLARGYSENPFTLFTLESWIELVCDFLERLDPEIVIQRLFGWAPPEDLIAPRWLAGKAEILNRINRAMESRNSWQGKLFERKVTSESPPPGSPDSVKAE